MDRPQEPEPPRPACEICELRPGVAVQSALTNALLIERPVAGAILEAHGWSMRVGGEQIGPTTFRCPEHAP